MTTEISITLVRKIDCSLATKSSFAINGINGWAKVTYANVKKNENKTTFFKNNISFDFVIFAKTELLIIVTGIKAKLRIFCAKSYKATYSELINAPINTTSNLFFIDIIAEVKNRLRLSFVTETIELSLGFTKETCRVNIRNVQYAPVNK